MTAVATGCGGDSDETADTTKSRIDAPRAKRLPPQEDRRFRRILAAGPGESPAPGTPPPPGRYVCVLYGGGYSTDAGRIVILDESEYTSYDPTRTGTFTVGGETGQGLELHLRSGPYAGYSGRWRLVNGTPFIEAFSPAGNSLGNGCARSP